MHFLCPTIEYGSKHSHINRKDFPAASSVKYQDSVEDKSLRLELGNGMLVRC